MSSMTFLIMWFVATNSDTLDGVHTTIFIVLRIALQVWQVFDSVTINTNTHPIETLTWAASGLVGHCR
jgi:hypothetical protein